MLIGSFDIVSPLRSAAADVEMIEVVDKIIAEFGAGKGGLEANGYEFHISHETSTSTPPKTISASKVNLSFSPLFDTGHRTGAITIAGFGRV